MKTYPLFSSIFIIPLLLFMSCLDADDDTSKSYADVVVEAPGDTGSGFGDSTRAINGVRGAGSTAGGTDVFSLYYDSGVNNYIILRWKGRRVLNGEGDDLVVFENPFDYTQESGSGRFMDHVVVSLSLDMTNWVEFPHDYTYSDETEYSTDPQYWIGFAGVTPVLYHEENNPADPFEQAGSGGDHFDLDDLPSPGGDEIRGNGFLYIKLTAAPSLENPDTPGYNFVKEDISNGADIDGVYARYFLPE